MAVYDLARDRPGRLDWAPTIDGMRHLFGTLTAVDGVRVKTELERITDDLYRQAVRHNNATPGLAVPARGELRSQAVVEMVRRAAARAFACPRNRTPAPSRRARGRSAEDALAEPLDAQGQEQGAEADDHRVDDVQVHVAGLGEAGS